MDPGSGARWGVEDAIKLGKSAAGMADYEVRSFHGWYRHITLAQLAAAFLAVADVQTTQAGGPPASTHYTATTTTQAQRGGRS